MIVLRNFRHYQGHHTTDCLQERCLEREHDNLPWKDESQRGLSSQSDAHWNCFEGSVGETSEREGGVHISFSEGVDTILN